MLARLSLIIFACVALAFPAVAKQYFVTNQAEYFAAEKNLKAGDTIILANGVWRDFEIKLSGQGTESAPITLTVEEFGKVIISGQSNLRIGGQYIVVKGLVFKNGYSPTSQVISFRRTKTHLATHSRVTQTVIDHFNKPDRYESDYWVGIYGKHNRFDHNHLVGKSNKGVTLAVRLDSEASLNNYHRIDHNYFGPRPTLGSNGGETLRIGTSKYSMFDSNTLVENNYFDRCDGEIEIISSKSGGNIFRGNVFYESQGTLTLRHGDGNLVENNIFFGNGKDHTGGIRIINQKQTVRNNYMEGLRGTGFASALTIMNGVPNSPVNRYVQVSEALIENNTVVDSARVTLAGGADEERSAPPVNSRFANNLLSGMAETEGRKFVRIQDDISGIRFADNRLVTGALPQSVAGQPIAGIAKVALTLVRGDNGLLYPQGAEVGAPRNLRPITREQVGVSWYPKPLASATFGTGETLTVAPGEDSLTEALAQAKDGDQLILRGGNYIVNRVLLLDKSLAIVGAEGADVRIAFARPSLFEIREGGNLHLRNLSIDGDLAPDSVGNAVIRTSSFPMQSNFVIEIDGIAVTNLDVNKSFHFVALGKSSFADKIAIRRSHFKNISGSVLQAAAETEDYGQYNVEYVTIAESNFEDIGGAAIHLYRGGRDESTFGPHFQLARSAFANVGRSANNTSGAAIVLHGVQHSKVETSYFAESAPLKIVHTVGRPQTRIANNMFVATPPPRLEELNYSGKHRALLLDNRFASEAKP